MSVSVLWVGVGGACGLGSGPEVGLAAAVGARAGAGFGVDQKWWQGPGSIRGHHLQEIIRSNLELFRGVHSVPV